MTREEFIEELEERGYSYEIEEDKLIVTEEGAVHLGFIESIPPDVEFRNAGKVAFVELKTLPSGVVFRNAGHVYLKLLETIPPGVEFKNRGSVWLCSLKSLRGYLKDWEGNIEGVDPNELFNKMIELGLFDRR